MCCRSRACTALDAIQLFLFDFYPKKVDCPLKVGRKRGTACSDAEKQNNQARCPIKGPIMNIGLNRPPLPPPPSPLLPFYFVLCLSRIRTPRSYDMSNDGASFVVVTGPNMGGKSTYIRALGAVAVMAQVCRWWWWWWGGPGGVRCSQAYPVGSCLDRPSTEFVCCKIFRFVNHVTPFDANATEIRTKTNRLRGVYY